MNFFNNHNIVAGISEKKDGSMKSFLKNRSLFLNNSDQLNKKIIVSAGLVHGNSVVVIEDGLDINSVINNCDALITNNNKYLLIVTVADCLPIYFYDKNKGVVAIAHAGWRGVLSEIVSKVIDSFINHYSSSPSDIEVYIGPHIKDCHFEVKNDVANYFPKEFSFKRKGKIYINLSQVVKSQLSLLKIKDSNINISNECTFCLAKKYFSFRRDKPKVLEIMLAYIGLK